MSTDEIRKNIHLFEIPVKKGYSCRFICLNIPPHNSLTHHIMADSNYRSKFPFNQSFHTNTQDAIITFCLWEKINKQHKIFNFQYKYSRRIKAYACF